MCGEAPCFSRPEFIRLLPRPGSAPKPTILSCPPQLAHSFAVRLCERRIGSRFGKLRLLRLAVSL